MKRFDAAVLATDPARRTFLLDVGTAALAAVDPVASINRVVSRRGGGLAIGEGFLSLDGLDRCVVLGFGKASVGMGRAAAAMLDDLPTTGILVTN
jgi:glycerate-2-kinase